MPSNTSLTTNTQSSFSQIAILGECMIELSGPPLTPLHQGFSGDTLNTAIYLKRLTQDISLDVHYATALGTDAFSVAMLEQWKQEEINCKYVAQLPNKNPGIYYIQVDDSGERSFSYWRNDSAAKQYLEQDNASKILKAIPNFDALYISGISLAIFPQSSRDTLLLAIKKMRANGGRLIFDNNYRPLLWTNKEETMAVYKTFMAECDIALLTFDDEVMLYGNISEYDVFKHCKNLGIEEVVIKRGAEPCLIQKIHKGTTTLHEVPATQVDEVVDTTAAGDSFSAAYLAARLHGKGPEQAAQWGHQLAGAVIQHRGAIISQKNMPNISG